MRSRLRAFARVAAAFYREDQARDDRGRWTSDGGGTTIGQRIAQVRTHVAPIAKHEARGNSRPVSAQEFQRLAAQGRTQLEARQRSASPPSGLDAHWDAVKQDAYQAVQQSWGGATYDAHTGTAIAPNADAFALTAKTSGQDTVRIPEHATYAEFSDAMDLARAEYANQLSWSGGHLGVFHDDEQHSIDVDPVIVLTSQRDVETIGAYTHAVGGAYRFSDGNGYFPPHVKEAA